MTRTSVPSAWDDRSVLGSVLDYGRATVRAKCAGVSSAGARATPLMTSPLMSLGFESPLGRLLDEYDEQCAHSRQVVADLDLDTVAARPLEHMPDTTPTLRWILTEMILETSRHVGHMDLLRELADGAKGM